MPRGTNANYYRPSYSHHDADFDTDNESYSSDCDFSDSDYSDSASSSSSTSSTTSSPPIQNPPRPQQSTPLIHVISYSRTLALTNGPPSIPHSILYTIDCCHLPPPPRLLCHEYFGTDPPLAASFFSFPENERAYQDAVADIWGLLHEPGGRRRGVGGNNGDLAVMVRCKAGMHRSVAMAERVGRKVNAWGGWRAVVEHWDLGLRIQERREKRERERRRMRERERERGWEGQADRDVIRSEHFSGVRTFGGSGGYGGYEHW